jgi:RNA ligase (TIGR02306 family)
MQLATFETITEIIPIEGADRIELAKVQAWQSVIRKNDYKVGDQVIFVPIDTVLTPAVWNKHLWDKNDPTKPIRVRTVRMRGAVSQGLIFPKSLVSAQEIFDHMDDPTEDVSIAGMLGITKYEKQIHASLAGVAKGDFPSHFVSKTDEDNLKSNTRAFAELKNCAAVSISLKLDGTSGTFIKELDGTFRVCSRNLELHEDAENVHWQMARKYNLQELLKPGTAIQGEIVGPKIQKNPMGLNAPELFCFNYKNLQTSKYHHADEHTLDLIPTGLKWVPHIATLSQTAFQYETIESLQELANKQQYANGVAAEGIVLRGLNAEGELMYSESLHKMLSVKIINQNYID